MVIGRNPKPSRLMITTYVFTPRFFCSILWGENEDLKYTTQITLPSWGLNLVPSFEEVQAFWGNSASKFRQRFLQRIKRLDFLPVFLCPLLFFLNKSNISDLWAQRFERKGGNTITNSNQSFQFMNLLFHPWNIQVAFIIISKTPYYVRQQWNTRLVCFPYF